MTTQHMEEADLLGDRIAILRQGKLRCMGTAFELKNSFGIGYHLTMVKNDNKASDKEIDAFMEAFFDKDWSSIKVLNSSAVEITYQLPTVLVPRFPTFFSELDQNCGKLGIKSYGIQMTTLEEVFLKIAAEDQKDPTESREIISEDV